MTILTELRNAVAHADGDINKMNQKLRITQMVRSTTGLHFRRDRYLEVDSEFISETLEMMRKLFGLVHSGFPARVRRAKQ